MNKQLFRFTLFLLDVPLQLHQRQQHKWKSQPYPVQITPL